MRSGALRWCTSKTTGLLVIRPTLYLHWSKQKSAASNANRPNTLRNATLVCSVWQEILMCAMCQHFTGSYTNNTIEKGLHIITVFAKNVFFPKFLYTLTYLGWLLTIENGVCRSGYCWQCVWLTCSWHVFSLFSQRKWACHCNIFLIWPACHQHCNSVTQATAQSVYMDAQAPLPIAVFVVLMKLLPDALLIRHTRGWHCYVTHHIGQAFFWRRNTGSL